jgi:Kelch motif
MKRRQLFCSRIGTALRVSRDFARSSFSRESSGQRRKWVTLAWVALLVVPFAPCDFTETNNSYVYDPVADSISSIASIPRVTGETQAVTVANEMWVLGGRTAPNASTEVNIYNPLTGQWRVGLPLSTGQRNFPAASDGTRVFLAGGYNSSSMPLRTAQIYGDTSKFSSSPILLPAVGTGKD